MIKLNEVSKDFLQGKETVTALTDVSLTINKMAFFGLVGESGSGKSTLLRLINGLERPTTGEIMIEGKNLLHTTEKEKRKLIQKMAMIFQQFNLLQNLTVKQNVSLPLKIQGRKDDVIVEKMLAFVGMKEQMDKYPSQLSGGQKQRVAIARALTLKPDILLCDEPTSALDAKNSQEVMRLLKKAQIEFKTTIVLVSHELPLIKQWCDQAGIMENGRLLSVVTVTQENQQIQKENYYERALEYLT